MSKQIYSLTFLLCAIILSIDVLADEQTEVNFNGLQLAWVMVPNNSTSEQERTEQPKSKPKKPAVKKPAKPIKANPVSPVVITKPTHILEVKPVQLPVANPAQILEVKPVQLPVTKTVQPVVESKPVLPHVAKPLKTPVLKSSAPPSPDYKHSFEWVLGLGADFGGEELGTVYYSDGSSASVKANNGIELNAGFIISNGEDSAFSTQMTLGYKSGGPRVWNRDVNWTAVPVEVIEYYSSGNTHMGLGISYQINPQLNVSLPSVNFTNKYNNAIGLVAQIGWAPAREHYSIDLRYTAIKFQLSDVQNAPVVDGSVGGIYLNYYY